MITKVGTELFCRADEYAERMNSSVFVTKFRTQTVTHSCYIKYISDMYLVAVTFNRALVKGMGKIDNVHDRAVLDHLIDQLEEEQVHNGMYRAMLNAHHINHEAIYDLYKKYVGSFSAVELARMTDETLAAVKAGQKLSAFPNAVLPQSVLALCEFLLRGATDVNVTFWEHFAAQTAVEAIIYRVVSYSIYPGVRDRSDLNVGDESIAWWREHAKQEGAAVKESSDEEKHLKMAQLMLDRKVDEALASQVLTRCTHMMELFIATASDPNRG